MEIKSSLLKDVLYNEADKSLLVTFAKNNKKYKYEDVPKELYEDFMASDSKGSFFLKNIKFDRKVTKIEEEKQDEENNGVK